MKLRVKEQKPDCDSLAFGKPIDSLTVCEPTGDTLIQAMFVSDASSCAPDSELLIDMRDGTVYKCHPVFSQNHNALQIIAYYDEIELCNPLGSHAKLHKLRCLFFTLGNIPAKFRSQLKCIFLVSIATLPIIQKHRIDELLNPFVRDMRELVENKLKLVTDGKVM